VQSALQRPDSDEVLDALNALFVTRASGKETPPDIEAAGPGQAALLDTWVLFLSVDILLLLVSDAEALADMVPAHQRASAELRDAPVMQPEVVVEDAAAGEAAKARQRPRLLLGGGRVCRQHSQCCVLRAPISTRHKMMTASCVTLV
jgi:hypothetical protein